MIPRCLSIFGFNILLVCGLCAMEEGVPMSDSPDRTNPASTGSPGMTQMVQSEIDRRKEVAYHLNALLELADRLYQSGEWDHAEAKFNLVLLQTNAEGQFAGYHQKAKIGKARCLTAKALHLEEQGNLSESAGLIKQALDLDPGNKKLARRAEEIKEENGLQNGKQSSKDPATKELAEKTAEIRNLLTQADQLTETGQLVKARSKLDEVRRIDPYNREARKKIEVIEEKRILSADLRYLASREKALAKVSEAWLPPPPAKISSNVQLQTGPNGGSTSAKILKKLADIKIPELIFNQRPIRDAVDELQKLSEQYDPDKQGLNFVLRLDGAKAEGSDPESATVSLELRDIPLQTALKYLCEQIRGGEKLRFEVEDNAVFLLPATGTGGDLETRSYNLPASLIANLAPQANSTGDLKRDDAVKLGTEILKNIGVNTEVEGAKAVCFRDTAKIVVRNTPAELNKIEQRIRDAQGEKAQKQFEVETKFLQFSDNDVKNFTFNLQMTAGNTGQGTNVRPPPSGTPGGIAPPGYGTSTDGLRGVAGLNQNGVSLVALQNLLDPTFPQTQSGQIGINGMVFNRGFSAILQLLQNAIGKDLVAAPRVTLADGKESKIIISREMFYPTTYTQPTVPNNDQGVGAGFILPSNPTGFEARDIGVTLYVKGESTSVPRAVDLDFTKLEVEDFEGFVNYGSQIASVSFGEGPLTTGDPNVVPPVTVPIGQAPFLVPIFSKRSLQSRVRLLDGETVGLGGLISESVQKVDDKIPALGDIPIFGRFFRSEASQKIKLNLVIFCTVRIVEPDGTLSFPEDNDNADFAQAGSAEMMPSVP